MQRTLIVLALIFLSASASTVDVQELKNLWSSWKIYYGKAYGLAEEAARFAIFVENHKKINQFNAENDDVKQALNKFADLTSQEFKNVHSGCFRMDLHNPANEIYEEVEENVVLADSVDWRAKGAVTAVKDQGQCGSCWSFSTTGVLEGFHFIQKGELLTFSEQQIVDCDTNDSGCDGGLPYLALEYTAKAGLEGETDYPYKAQDGECNYKKLKATNTNKGYTLIQTKSATALKNAIVNSPVSIGIEADEQVFQFYKSGVISKNCGDSLDHAVLAVGYTTVSGTEAYIVKNSWGADWGQAGYVYISTDGSQNDGNGVCGILGQPSVPK